MNEGDWHMLFFSIMQLMFVEGIEKNNRDFIGYRGRVLDFDVDRMMCFFDDLGVAQQIYG